MLPDRQLPDELKTAHVVVPLREVANVGRTATKRNVHFLNESLRRIFSNKLGLSVTAPLNGSMLIGVHDNHEYCLCRSFATEGYPRLHIIPTLIQIDTIVDELYLLLDLEGHIDSYRHHVDHNRQHEAERALSRIRRWFQQRFKRGQTCLDRHTPSIRFEIPMTA